jgi:predicted house-cleaning noncanonical NTP pyrophosphatase (MazG superfamily)
MTVTKFGTVREFLDCFKSYNTNFIRVLDNKTDETFTAFDEDEALEEFAPVLDMEVTSVLNTFFETNEDGDGLFPGLELEVN